jgi:hypothetical protein
MKQFIIGLFGLISVSLVVISSGLAVQGAQRGHLSFGERSVTEAIWAFHGGCPDGCVGLREWWDLVGGSEHERTRIVAALFLAYDSTPGWRPYAQKAVRNLTPILAVDLDANGRRSPIGAYSQKENLILVDDELLDDKLDVLAGVLAHEIVHAGMRPGFWQELFDDAATRSRGECLEQEFEAVRWEVEVFSNTPVYTHDPDSFAWEIVRRREALQGGSLIAAVAELYTDNCGFD